MTQASAKSTRGWTLLFVVGLVAGIGLRMWQLDAQVLVDDEWHAVHKLLRTDWANIATHFGFADHSIPLTLYFRFLYTQFGLSEWRMHAPMLAAGVALIAAAPWLARDWASWPVRAVWAALLATSPLLVYHSRTARPYALTSLLTFVAIVAFWRWRSASDGRRGWAALYAIAVFGAGWLHAITLPFTLAPLLFEAVAAIRGKSQRTLVRIVGLGACTALILAVALVPPLIVDGKLLAAKAGTDYATPESVYRAWMMLAGTAHGWVFALTVGLAAWGASRLRKRDGTLVAYLLTIALCGVVATIAARPAWIQHPLVMARYLIPLLPIALLFVAEGAVGLIGRIPWPAAAPAIAGAGILALLAQGPLPAQLKAPSQFTGHLRYQFDYDPAFNPYVTLVPKEPVPEFYRRLAALPPGSRTLIEAPWRLESNFNPHPWYQDVHRQHVRIGLVTPVCGVRDFGEYSEDAGMRMRNFAHLSALLRGDIGDADYLVMHIAPWKTPPDAEVEWPDVAQCLPPIEARFGAPVYRDERIVVFALKPERREAL